ncbi:MAG TPA: YceI family protein [Blastocatellia bacterium]|nr:YceI family protein [Blastocatellia bacterium]
MKKLILAIPRRAAHVACVIVLLLGQNQDLSAQRAKRKDKTRVYTIDLSRSRVTATLTQEGFIARRYPTHRVEVKNFGGKIEVSERNETRIAVEVEAEAKSLTNADEGMTEFERREFHNVLNNLVLESDKFPKIKFVSVSISDARKSGETRIFTLNGDLTLRDATKRVSFPVTVTISKDQLRASGEAELKQSDFGIKPYSGKLGMIKIGDDVKINFEIVAKSP